MARGTQDNDDELTFVKLAAVTANVVRWLMKVDEEKDEDTGGNPDAGKTNKQSPEDERRYIDTRLKEIAAWERKIRNGKM
jgi:hypothetical protein